MTVPLETVMAELPLERREAVIARSKELIQDNQQRLALRGILRYVEHQDKPGKDDRGTVKPTPSPHYEVFLGTQRVASIRDLMPARSGKGKPSPLDMERAVAADDQAEIARLRSEETQHANAIRNGGCWRAFFYVQWAEAVTLDEYDLQDCKDRLETAILQWLAKMQLAPLAKSAENS